MTPSSASKAAQKLGQINVTWSTTMLLTSTRKGALMWPCIMTLPQTKFIWNTFALSCCCCSWTFSSTSRLGYWTEALRRRPVKQKLLGQMASPNLHRSRRGSITNEILSRFDEDSQHRRMSTARRLSASFRSMVFKSELQGEEGAANEEAAVDAEAASRPRTQRRDSTREFVMKRLQSSNVLTWK